MVNIGTSGYSSGGVQVEAILTGLLPDKEYFYRIKGSSRVFSFRSAPKRNDMAMDMVSAVHGAGVIMLKKPCCMQVVFGDMGQSLVYFDGNNTRQHSFDFGNRGEIPATDTARSLARLIQEQDIAVINHIGDISYATG